MENETETNIPSGKSPEGKQIITTPTAIIVAGVLVMLALLITRGGNGLGGKTSTDNKDKTLSEQVGVKQDAFKQCMDATNLDSLRATTNDSANLAMKALPADQRGTPYSVIVGKNGVKTEIKGAYPIEDVRKLIAEVNSGKVTTAYKGEITAVTANDHILGDINAPVVIVEYADLECPFCKRFSGVMKQIVAESNGQVAWVYRHWVVHPGALPKAGAAECVAKLQGNDAFWKYIDLVFGLLKTADDAPDTSNL